MSVQLKELSVKLEAMLGVRLQPSVEGDLIHLGLPPIEIEPEEIPDSSCMFCEGPTEKIIVPHQMGPFDSTVAGGILYFDADIPGYRCTNPSCPSVDDSVVTLSSVELRHMALSIRNIFVQMGDNNMVNVATQTIQLY